MVTSLSSASLFAPLKQIRTPSILEVLRFLPFPKTLELSESHKLESLVRMSEFFASLNFFSLLLVVVPLRVSLILCSTRSMTPLSSRLHVMLGSTPPLSHPSPPQLLSTPSLTVPIPATPPISVESGRLMSPLQLTRLGPANFTLQPPVKHQPSPNSDSPSPWSV